MKKIVGEYIYKTLENEFIKVIVNTDNGSYSIYNNKNNELCIKDGFARIDNFIVGYYDENNFDNERKKFYNYQSYFKNDNDYINYERQRWNVKSKKTPHLEKDEQYQVTGMDTDTKNIEDCFGKGETLIIKCFRLDAPTVMLQITLYEKSAFVSFNMGVINNTNFPIRIREMHPVSGAGFFEEISNKSDVKALDGMAGSGFTKVTDGSLIQSSNNILVTFKADEKTYSLTAGGLSYDDFAKYFCIDRKDCIEQKGEYRVETCSDESFGIEKIDFMAYDPHGRYVDPYETYIPDDVFYLDFITSDPFESLEKYAKNVKTKNNIRLNSYQFPIVNCWYASNKEYGKGIDINNTPATIAEMKAVKEIGFFKYAPVAIQLEPDKYHGNSEQGWWDDKHFEEYGHYQKPYETTKKWCEGLKEIGAIPYFYVQSGLPSDDFAKAYPQYMINNDISSIFLSHNHHQTYVSYDYSDIGLQKHLNKAWNNLSNNGVKGVKFDYPEAAWRPDGGFDNKYYTTAKAYKKMFEIAREGLGKNVMINERNLGEGNRPVVDVTIGYADTQRVWADASSFDPLMVTKAGLRWYKNRCLYNYDIEAKTFFARNEQTNELELLDRYMIRSILTMCYVVSGRLLMANSFTELTPEIIYDLGRIFPVHSEERMARPTDAFTNTSQPQVYDYEINKDWHQLTLFNTDTEKSRGISTNLSGDRTNCSLCLDKQSEYYIYNFWEDRFEGIYKGDDVFSAQLMPCEAAMYSVHKKEKYPQFISSNRHIMQGYVDIANCEWNKEDKTLSATSSVVQNETYEVVIALNGFEVKDALCSENANIKLEDDNELIRILIYLEENRDIRWTLFFK